MHISDGILAPEWCLVWFAIAIPFIAVGVWQIKRGIRENASYLPMLAMMGAAVFVIAGVLAMNPKIIVLDEPTSNLDPRTSSGVMHLLVDLSRRMNIALIIATHDVDAVPQYADKIYVMHKGRFVSEGTPEAVFSDASVIRGAHLRLPRIAHLMEILHKEDKLPLQNPYPLTIRAARTEIVRLMRQGMINNQSIKGEY